MKAVLAIVAFLGLTAPAFAGEDSRSVDASLAKATRQATSVAPWVKVRVGEVKAGGQLSWLAATSGGQRYSCSAQRSSSGAYLADRATCARLTQSPAERLTQTMRYKATTEANLQVAQARRARITVMPTDAATLYH